MNTYTLTHVWKYMSAYTFKLAWWQTEQSATPPQPMLSLINHQTSIVELSFRTNSISAPNGCALMQSWLAVPCACVPCVRAAWQRFGWTCSGGTAWYRWRHHSHPSLQSDFTQENHLLTHVSQCVPSLMWACAFLRGEVPQRCTGDLVHSAALWRSWESTAWLLETSLKPRFRPQEETTSQVQIEKWQSNSLRDTWPRGPLGRG